MNVNLDRERNAGKKPYVKPEVKEVLLKPEEAVLGACKHDNSAGPLQPVCKTPGKCKLLGS